MDVSKQNKTQFNIHSLFYFFILFSLLFLFGHVGVFAQINEPIETNWEGVTATLLTCQQDEHRLYMVVEFHNETNETVTGDGALYFKDVYLYDLENDRKVFILRDANGIYLAGPFSDFNDGGRWWIELPPNEKTRLWAFFAPFPESTSSIDVYVPQLMPFYEIPIQNQEFSLEEEHQGVFGSLSVSIISAKRRTGAVSVRLRLKNIGSEEIDCGALFYRDAYLYDYHNQRKYPVLKDEDGYYLAEPKSDNNEGGRWWVSNLKPEKQQILSLTFQAPPDSVSEVGIVVPFLLPFARVTLSGSSGVDQESGIEVIGVEKTVERVIKDVKIEETDTELKLMLDAAVLFDYDKSEIRPDAESSLLSVLTVIEEHPNTNIRIEGHTDNTGSDDYNQKLSEKRADTVKGWLIENGCSPDNLTTIGYGESKPIASNDSESGRQQNRRVEIIIKK